MEHNASYFVEERSYGVPYAKKWFIQSHYLFEFFEK